MARNFIVIVGQPGAGKTTFTLGQIEGHPDKKALIVDKQGEKKYMRFPTTHVAAIKLQKSGIYRIYEPRMREKWKPIVNEVHHHFRNGLVIYEDASGWLPKHEYLPLMDQIISRRHFGLDIIMTFHTMNRVPPYILENLNTLVLFKTGDNFDSHIKDEIQKPDIVMSAFDSIEANSDPHFYQVLHLGNSLTKSATSD